ncbi:hypothetical protein [Paenibacillus sp. GCM10027626]|uniref:hypothetical protein n=1 Tax=Paenibacillus sp. GCM10027626 TaxID=3273411 RepID=UPI00362AEEA5
MEEQGTICPWCQTEIVWDEEIGPERYCPHCDNELSGYRTVRIGIDAIDGQDDEDDEDDELEEEQEERYMSREADVVPFLSRTREHLALEETVEKMLDQQEEVPECPSCREYMLEAGKETVDGGSFVSTHVPALEEPLLSPPFAIIRYICPTCFTMQSKLDKADQERLVHTLSRAADKLR